MSQVNAAKKLEKLISADDAKPKVRAQLNSMHRTFYEKSGGKIPSRHGKPKTTAQIISAEKSTVSPRQQLNRKKAIQACFDTAGVDVQDFDQR